MGYIAKGPKGEPYIPTRTWAALPRAWTKSATVLIDYRTYPRFGFAMVYCIKKFFTFSC